MASAFVDKDERCLAWQVLNDTKDVVNADRYYRERWFVDCGYPDATTGTCQ